MSTRFLKIDCKIVSVRGLIQHGSPNNLHHLILFNVLHKRLSLVLMMLGMISMISTIAFGYGIFGK